MSYFSAFFQNLDFHGLNLFSVCFRLGLSIVFGGIIGLERAFKRRPAGFRTYMLVCMGATLVMITGQYIHSMFAPSDPARLGAQVISGIGFLGAGTIIVTQKHQVVGLTTAAGLWACACMGLALGIGFYDGAIAASIFIFIIFTLMNKLDYRLMSNSKTMDIYVEINAENALSEFLGFLHGSGIKIVHIELVKLDYSRSIAAIIALRLPKRHPHIEVVTQLKTNESVYYLEEL